MIPIDQIATQLLVMAISAVAGWLGGKLRGAADERRKAEETRSDERDSVREAMRLLLFYRLHDLFDEYVVDGGSITAADKHEIEELYRIYHEDFNGNGEGSRIYHELMDLKTE